MTTSTDTPTRDRPPAKRMRRRAPMAAVLIALGAALLGCGGSNDAQDGARQKSDESEQSEPSEKTFSDDRFAFTFSYPDEFQPDDDFREAESVGKPVARVVLALDADNVIGVSRYEMGAPVTSANVDEILPQSDDVLGQLTGRPVHGRVTEVGGFPAIRYDAISLEEPARGQSLVVFLFDQKDQYQLNCQSTPEERARLNAACDRMLATLRTA